MAAPLYVLTGGPCTGKSTLLEAFSAEGFPVVREAARELLEEAIGPEERRDPSRFQQRVLERQLRLERDVLSRAGSAPCVFADRGIGDHFAYYRIEGLAPPPEVVEAWEEARRRYRAVFLLEPGPRYRRAGIRVEPPARARRLQELLEREYRARHPRVVRVPWEPVESRVRRILREVGLSRPSGLASEPGVTKAD